jgi:two-component system heavy metal sensor histidine kinase CusS
MRSISTRLTLLYTLVALVAMGLFAAVGDWRLSTNFDAEHGRFLQSKIAELQTDLNDGGGWPKVLLDEVAKETSESRLRQYQARVLAGDGRLLGETPGMQHGLPVELFPPVGSADLRLGDVRERKVDAHVYALATVQLHTSAATMRPRVQIALDTTRDANLLTDFRRAMWLAFALLIPLLAIAGRWVSARGLAPLTRIVGAARDVTPTHLSARIPTSPPWPSELSELVQVFNAMLTRLDEAFVRLSRFSADLAHELRTPLSNMSGELEVCLMRERSADEYRVVLESGLEECRRLNVLIDNLLFMARAEHAGLALHCERFSAAQTCAWVIEQHAPAAVARGIRIRLDGTADINADPMLFRQALANLLTNAVRHSPAGGEVRVDIGAPAGGDVQVRVSDAGKGIGVEHLPHLFDRFYQVDTSRAREAGQGTGLGLSIVKTIVDLHGGSVEAHSRLGDGTTVTLHFPAGDRPTPG